MGQPNGGLRSELEAEGRELLARLVRIDTSNPPGREGPAAEALAEYLERAGVEAEVVPIAPGRGALRAVLPGSVPGLAPLLLLSHLDVAPADPEAWTRDEPPFGGVITGAAIHGRGTVGGKALAVAHAVALARIAREGARLPRPIMMVAVPDGEGPGSLGLARLVELRPDILNAGLALTEGGLALSDLLPGKRPLFAIATAEKGFVELEVTATGPSGSAALSGPVTASNRLSQALARLEARKPRPHLSRRVGVMLDEIGAQLGLPHRLLWNSSPLVRPLTYDLLLRRPVTRAWVTEGMSVTRLSARAGSRAVSDRARATLFCQLLPGTTPGALLHEAKAAIRDPKVFITVRSAEVASTSSASATVLSQLRATLEQEGLAPVVVPGVSAESTEARVLRRHGVEAYGFAPFLLTQAELSKNRGAGEQLPLEALAAGIGRMKAAIVSLAAPTPTDSAGSSAPP